MQIAKAVSERVSRDGQLQHVHADAARQRPATQSGTPGVKTQPGENSRKRPCSPHISAVMGGVQNPLCHHDVHLELAADERLAADGARALALLFAEAAGSAQTRSQSWPAGTTWFALASGNKRVGLRTVPAGDGMAEGETAAAACCACVTALRSPAKHITSFSSTSFHGDKKAPRITSAFEDSFGAYLPSSCGLRRPA